MHILTRHVVKLVAAWPINSRYHKNVLDHYNNPRNVGKLDKNFYNVVTWWLHSKSFNELVELSCPIKSKKISTVTSGKIGNNECRANRVKFLNRFIEKFPSIDVYGRGIKSHLHNKDCYKGVVKGDTKFCKFEGIIYYEYSVNTNHNSYFKILIRIILQKLI